EERGPGGVARWGRHQERTRHEGGHERGGGDQPGVTSQRLPPTPAPVSPGVTHDSLSGEAYHTSRWSPPRLRHLGSEHEVTQTFLELVHAKLSHSLADHGGTELHPLESRDGFDDRLRLLFLEEHASLVLHHCLERPSGPVSDNWTPASLGLERHKPVVLIARENDGAAPGVQVVELPIRHTPEEDRRTSP